MLAEIFNGSLSFSHQLLLLVSLVIVLGFEFVNGFHDTANAVATVIYTNTLRPWVAVIWSGICNFAGVFLGGIAVAYSIVHLLPVDLLIDIKSSAGIAMVLSLLVSAIIWNFGTWYLGLPASSSHALIGSILGVGLANSLMTGQGLSVGVNWSKAAEVGLSLLLSPLLGFGMAAILLLFLREMVKNEVLYQAPKNGMPPPFWIRCILMGTCTGVSFAHGSNDGQKGVGMVMLILIGLVPYSYAVNLGHDGPEAIELSKAATVLEDFLGRHGRKEPASADIHSIVQGRHRLAEIPGEQRWKLRTGMLMLDKMVGATLTYPSEEFAAEERVAVSSARATLRKSTEYAPTWVLVAVAMALGVGTTIGWKRIVVTVGEKIGKQHLTYAQGAVAETVAMSTIGIAVISGLPVSTTQVLSSAIAGTMAASNSGVEMKMINKIALAWVLTLPVTMLMSGLFLAICRIFV